MSLPFTSSTPHDMHNDKNAHNHNNENGNDTSFARLFIPWIRWCLLFFAAVLLTVLTVTRILSREPDSVITDLLLSTGKPLEVGAEQRARERLRNAHAEFIERMLLVFGPADEGAVMRQFAVAEPSRFLIGEERVLMDLIRGGYNIDSTYSNTACDIRTLKLLCQGVCRLMHLRRWFPSVECTILVERMLRHAGLYKEYLPADLLLQVDLLGVKMVRVRQAVLFYELRGVFLTTDMLYRRIVRLLKQLAIRKII